MSEVLWTELEKLDVLRERMGVGYEEARTALNLAQGDLVKALDNLEKASSAEHDWSFAEQSEGIWDSFRSKMADFNHTKISLKKHENTIVSLSAPLGLALAYTIWRKPALRVLALVGAIGAAANHFELEVSSEAQPVYQDDALNFTADPVDK